MLVVDMRPAAPARQLRRDTESRWGSGASGWPGGGVGTERNVGGLARDEVDVAEEPARAAAAEGAPRGGLEGGRDLGELGYGGGEEVGEDPAGRRWSPGVPVHAALQNRGSRVYDETAKQP